MNGKVCYTFAVLTLLSCALAVGGTNAPVAPDILLIVIDSLRADVIGCYGETRPTSPVIDALSAKSVRFANAIASAPWTEPSIMTLFTSLPPERHGLVLSTVPYVTNVTTLAECLRKAGYQTVGLTANPSTHRRRGFGRGFDYYDDFTIAMDPGGDLALAAAQSAAQTATGGAVTRLAENWLRRRDPARPLFLFLHYMDPHWDYIPPPDCLRLFTADPVPALRNIYRLGQTFVPPPARARIRSAYAGEIRYTDGCIGRLLAAIQASPRADSTAVALCGDHGEAFWEHGCVGHGNNLYDEEIRVPLIVRAPDGEGFGVVVTGQVGLIDLAPTLLDLAGVAPPPDWEGVSLRACFTTGVSAFRPLVLDNRIGGGPMRGVRTPTCKIVGRPPFETVSEVYDLVADPGETNNLAADSGAIPPAATALIPLLHPSDIATLTPKESNP